MPHIKIQIFNGETKIDEQTFNSDVIKIGKLKSSHICLDDENAARMHAVIECTDKFVIIDLGSEYGTYVNNKRIAKTCVLHTEDEITIGNSKLIITFEEKNTEKEKVEETKTNNTFENDIINDLAEIKFDDKLSRIDGKDNVIPALTQQLKTILKITPPSVLAKNCSRNPKTQTIYVFFFDFQKNEYIVAVCEVQVYSSRFEGMFTLHKLSNVEKYIPEKEHKNILEKYSNIPSMEDFISTSGRKIILCEDEVTLIFKNTSNLPPRGWSDYPQQEIAHRDIAFSGKGASIYDAYVAAYLQMKETMLGIK